MCPLFKNLILRNSTRSWFTAAGWYTVSGASPVFIVLHAGGSMAAKNIFKPNSQEI